MHGHPPGQSAAHARVPILVFTSGGRRRALPASLLALALLAGASACSSSDSADPPATTAAAPSQSTTTAPTTTTEPQSEEDEVAEAYLEAQALFFEIGTHPDPTDPRLSNHFGEPNLTLIRSGFMELLEDEIYARFPDGSAPIPTVVDVQINGSSAEIKACVVDDVQQVRRSDGVVVNDAIVSKEYEATLARSAGGWKVVDGLLTQTWQDGKGCQR